MDASNIIKPALARGEMQCIGATTLNEYRKFIEKDAALERRFQSVMVREPTVEETIEILKGLRDALRAASQRCHDTPTRRCAWRPRLSDQATSNDRFLPDKAIDVIDEAGARARISAMTRPPDIKEKEIKIEEIRKLKEEAIKAQKFEEAAAFRDQERINSEEVEKTMTAWRKSRDETIVGVNAEDIMIIISKWTGIPLARMEEREMARLLRMEEELEKQVVGQKEAVVSISKALRRSRADLKDPKRPIGSFIFLGPTGVGKTLLAKALAEFMFNDKDALIQIDMSEYMEKFAVLPPGRLAARLRRPRGGRAAHREGAAPALFRGAVRRDRKGAPRRHEHAPPDPGGGEADGQPGPLGGLPQHGHHHDLQHRGRPDPQGRGLGPARPPPITPRWKSPWWNPTRPPAESPNR